MGIRSLPIPLKTWVTDEFCMCQQISTWDLELCWELVSKGVHVGDPSVVPAFRDTHVAFRLASVDLQAPGTLHFLAGAPLGQTDSFATE